MKHNKQKRTRFVHLVTQIANLKSFYKGRESIYLTFLALVFIFSSYLHLIYYGNSDVNGNFFGFRWMSSFLFAISLPLTLLSSSLIFGSIGRRTKEPFLRLLSFMGCASGSFYLVWTFWTTPDDFTDISKTTYLFVLFGLSICFLFLINLIDKYAYITERELRQTIEKLRSIIKNLVNFILDKEEDSKNQDQYLKDEIELFKKNDIM